MVGFLFLCGSCSSGKAGHGDTSTHPVTEEARPAFNADSAYSFVEQLVAFGPRVPNTEAHRRAGNWLADKMKGYGWEVIEQPVVLTAFDGTPLHARNIFSRINPDKGSRLLLLAHWDSRPWADEDPDPAMHSSPVLGANDGASGIGVLLEIARQLGTSGSGETNQDAPGVDILFVDAEDWGSHDFEESWALGTRYFAVNPPVENYRPDGAILLDMVGSPNARFGYEYFSSHSNPSLQQRVWSNASRLGYGNYFHTGFGGAVTDDHVELIKRGIPSIDIIDYRDGDGYKGFDPVWHTSKDNMDNISRKTLQAVGETVMATLGRP